MQFRIDGQSVFASNGGRTHETGRPFALFVHGAGLDHTVWAMQSRWLAFHGWNVLALDLPGHGRSEGPPLRSVGALSKWIAALTVAAGAERATLIGHSMGSLIALDVAARYPERVQSTVLIAAAAAIPVNPELLAAAAANDHAAIDMVNFWGFGFAAGLGGNRAPGVWMLGAGERTLERAKPGVLHDDLAACNEYCDGTIAAAKVVAPTLLICGERDLMTPLKGARALAAIIPRAALVALSGAGHMLMAERPYEVVEAIANHLAVGRRRQHGA